MPDFGSRYVVDGMLQDLLELLREQLAADRVAPEVDGRLEDVSTACGIAGHFGAKARDEMETIRERFLFGTATDDEIRALCSDLLCAAGAAVAGLEAAVSWYREREEGRRHELGRSPRRL